MKHVRKALALMLATFVAFIIAAPAFAQDVDATSQTTNVGSITVENSEKGSHYNLIQVFEATVSPNVTSTTPASGIAYKLTDAQRAKVEGTNAVQALKTYFDTYWEFYPDGNYIKFKNAAAETAFKTSIDGETGNADFVTFATGIGSKLLQDNVEATDDSLTFNKVPYGYYVVTTDTGTASSNAQPAPATPKATAIAAVDSTTPDATVRDKNSITGITKTIESQTTNGATIGDQGHTNSAALNEDVNFKISGNAKNYEGTDKVFTYFIEDKMDPGFTIDESSIVVKVGGVELDPSDMVQSADGSIVGTVNSYTLTVNAAKDGFDVELPWTTDGTKAGKHVYGANDLIEITYTAKLDPAKVKAQGGVNIDGANNNIAYILNLKGNDTPTHTPPTPGTNTPKDETHTYVTGVEFVKQDDNQQALPGAEFTLTRADGTAFVGAVVEEKQTTIQVFPLTAWQSGTKWYLIAGHQNTATSTMADFTSDDPMEKKASVDWSDPSTYYDDTMTEAQAKLDNNNYEHDWNDYEDFDGSDPSSIVAYQEASNSTSGTTMVTLAKGAGQASPNDKLVATSGSDGKFTFAALAPGEYKMVETKVPEGYVKAEDLYFKVEFNSANHTFTITKSEDGGQKYEGATMGGIDATKTGQPDNLFTDTIIDPVGTEFPETGGMGTRILYTVGGLMVAGAAIYLITKKRMASEA